MTSTVFKISTFRKSKCLLWKTKLEKAFPNVMSLSLKLIFRKGLKPSFNLFKTLTNYLWKLQLFMFFLLKYLNLKFSNKFLSVPLSPNIIDMSIYYSITISTPWFIQTDIIFTGVDKAGPEVSGEIFFLNLNFRGTKFNQILVYLWMLLQFFYWTTLST